MLEEQGEVQGEVQGEMHSVVQSHEAGLPQACNGVTKARGVVFETGVQRRDESAGRGVCALSPLPGVRNRECECASTLQRDSDCLQQVSFAIGLFCQSVRLRDRATATWRDRETERETKRETENAGAIVPGSTRHGTR